MSPRGRSGSSLIEILLAVLIGGLLFLALARLADTVVRVDGAARAGSDARALQITTDRVLRRALEDAGAGMMSSPNLAGVGAVVGRTSGGAPADTLVVLRADGDHADVAARGCPAAAAPCVALPGDHARQFRAGDLVLVGTRALGMRAYQVAADPSVFYAPCGADCPERLVCSVSPGPLRSFPRVAGSVTSSGGASTSPCAQPYMPDGSSCREVVQTSTPGPIGVPFCRLSVAQSPFTALPLVDRTAVLGFRAAPGAMLQSGATGTPRVRAVRVRASRFWMRSAAADTLLVRQNGLDSRGQWNSAVPVGGRAAAFTVETLQGTGWVRGIGVSDDDLAPVTTNSNLAWRLSPAPSGTEAGFAFAQGYHTVRAVRARIRYRALGARGVAEMRDLTVVAPTPSILEGGTRDIP